MVRTGPSEELCLSGGLREEQDQPGMWGREFSSLLALALAKLMVSRSKMRIFSRHPPIISCLDSCSEDWDCAWEVLYVVQITTQLQWWLVEVSLPPGFYEKIPRPNGSQRPKSIRRSISCPWRLLFLTLLWQVCAFPWSGFLRPSHAGRRKGEGEPCSSHFADTFVSGQQTTVAWLAGSLINK